MRFQLLGDFGDAEDSRWRGNYAGRPICEAAEDITQDRPIRATGDPRCHGRRFRSGTSICG